MWDLNVMLLSEIILDPGLMLLTVHLNYLNLYINQRVLASVLRKETLRIWDLVKDILYDFCFRIQLQSLIWAKECSQLWMLSSAIANLFTVSITLTFITKMSLYFFSFSFTYLKDVLESNTLLLSFWLFIFF